MITTTNIIIAFIFFHIGILVYYFTYVKKLEHTLRAKEEKKDDV